MALRFLLLVGAVGALALIAAPIAAQSPVPLAPANGLAGDAAALACMTDAIAYEAGLEPVEGKEAVAQVIVNRLRNPIFPKTVCGVVYQGSERRTGCQFTFTCDGSLQRRLSEKVRTAARDVAEAVLDGARPDRVSGAMFYHAFYVMPRWAPRLARVTRIGAHIFYRPGLGRAGDPSRPGGDAAAEHVLTPDAAPREPFAPWGLPMAATSDQAAPHTL